MKAEVYDKENKKIGTVELPDGIFNVEWNPDLVHQAVTAQLANRRSPWASVKGRGDVRGGGKKPWKQKGTGRARHGSSRSPIWKGGGVTFGPDKERNYAKKINKKMKRLAIFSVLSKKTKDKELKIMDSFDVNAKKTKDWQKFLRNVADLRSSTLLIPVAAGKAVSRAVANIKKAEAISPYSLNVYDLISRKNILLEKGAIDEIKKHYSKEN
jgi:large subunit ribosomal protein L4